MILDYDLDFTEEEIAICCASHAGEKCHVERAKHLLNKIGVDNFKVSSDTHIWNAINYNNNWYHIDATWDDPVSQSGVDSLSHDYFIINTQQLKNLDVNNTDHNFDNKYYL